MSLSRRAFLAALGVVAATSTAARGKPGKKPPKNSPTVELPVLTVELER